MFTKYTSLNYSLEENSIESSTLPQLCNMQVKRNLDFEDDIFYNRKQSKKRLREQI